MRESSSRQVDKKSRVPEKERRFWGSRRGDTRSGILKEEERTKVLLFSLHSLVIVTPNGFSFSLELMIMQQTV